MDWSPYARFVPERLRRLPRPGPARLRAQRRTAAAVPLGYHVAAQLPEVSAVVATNLLDARDPTVRRGVSRPSFLGAVAGRLPPALDGVTLPIRMLCRMDRIANDPELVAACVTDPRGGGSSVPMGFLRSWFAYEPAVEPERFTRPVLLAHPAEDRWTPVGLSTPFLDRLAGPTELVMLEGCGHAPVEEPGITTLERAMGGFLAAFAR